MGNHTEAVTLAAFLYFQVIFIQREGDKSRNMLQFGSKRLPSYHFEGEFLLKERKCSWNMYLFELYLILLLVTFSTF